MTAPTLEIITGGRATGKTHQLVHFMVEHPEAVCCVANRTQADNLINRMRIDHHVEGSELLRRFVTPRSLDGLRGRRIPEVCIDNLDLFFLDMFGAPVTLATTFQPVKVSAPDWRHP